MDDIETSNPYLRNGSPCHRFQSAIQISIDSSFRKLPAVALVVAEVLTLQAYPRSNRRDYVIDLTTAEIRRSSVNLRKFFIKSGSHVFNIFCNNFEDADVWASILAYSSSRRFGDFYTLGHQIAKGRHSKVYLAHAKNDRRSIKYVVKVNNRVRECNRSLSRFQLERNAHMELIADFDVRSKLCRKEKKIDLEEMKHRELKLKLFLDKFVTLRDSFGTPSKDFLVFEYQDGEILSTFISKNGPLNERKARIVMWDLLSALHFMHDQGVVHRDVCASNVFYWDRCGKVWAKLFDLSEARQIPDWISGEEPFRGSPGKLQYSALEILSGRYHGKPADIWACGVLLYRMLSGIFPFQGETEEELRENIKHKLLSRCLFAPPIWNTVSPEAILLIKQLLQPDPFKRPSALGARSHKWLRNEFRLAQSDVPSYKKKLHVPQRLQTPVAKNLRLQTRSLSTCDPKALPAPLHSLWDVCIEDSEETKMEGEDLSVHDKHMTRKGKERSEVVSSDSEIPPSQELNGDSSNGSSGGTIRSSSDCDDSESRLSSSLESRRGFSVSFVTSLTQVFRSDRWRKMAMAFSEKLTKLQATVKDFRNRNELEREGSTDSSSEVDLDGSIAEQENLPAKPPQVVQQRKRIQDMLPDRKRGYIPEESSMLPLRSHSLAHRCNHLCSYRPCTRSTLAARADKMLRLQSRSMMKQSVATSPPLTTRRTTPDHAVSVRQQQRDDSSSEIVPITRFINEDVFLWARKTKLFSDLKLERAPLDPLFFHRPNSTARDAREEKKELLSKRSRAWQRSSPRLLLCDEMCVGTHIMKSVITIAHVGLPQFFERRPGVAKLILGSPTAQLHLSMILPYRRKFRNAGLALVAMFRIISLKQGTCLTRRIARGQPLTTELSTSLTDMRRDCNIRPFHARLPKSFPSDEFTDGAVCLKERLQPRPVIHATRQTFWSRQFEVKKGIITNVWNFVKDRVA